MVAAFSRAATSVETSSLTERHYDRRALMAAPHCVQCASRLPHARSRASVARRRRSQGVEVYVTIDAWLSSVPDALKHATSRISTSGGAVAHRVSRLQNPGPTWNGVTSTVFGSRPTLGN